MTQQRAVAFRAREQAILNAAEYLLLELGDESITIEMIAERVGIAKVKMSLFYNY